MSPRITIYLSVLLACSSFPAHSAELTISKERACSILRERVAVHDNVPTAIAQSTWSCYISSNSDAHWVVIGLHSNRQCEGICSSLLGWYAVDRTTGTVHGFDVAEMEVGPPIDASADRPSPRTERTREP